MADANPELAVALIDRYTIECEVGARGTATVSLAHDLRNGRAYVFRDRTTSRSSIVQIFLQKGCG